MKKAMKWNADLYDEKHAFVFQYGEDVLELLDAKPGEYILDLGCGTGHLTKQIQDKGAIVKGTDLSPDMIAQAKEKYPEVDFEIENAADFFTDKPYDAVFSNAALHWVLDQNGMMRSVYNSLKHGGRFVAEMGGKGNVGHLIESTQLVLQNHGYTEQADTKIWYFPSIAEQATKLEEHGFKVTYAILYDRKTPLQDGDQGVAKWVTMFGAQFLEGIPDEEKPQILKEITQKLEPYYNEGGQWYADYKRLRFVAVKE
ncbi:methyltransferase domain-containing protein [Mucilaginibacter aquaedulcis]|jgi:trans-aconitate methyltransferase|uniref:methyltransferase domain-containing protein n=1 Tax=Mucilaginibacter aquaedulcis TaxID=1187081 RepID=UPI0025B5D149|nr:methyltransferase domain-containing protein [Mucilaginibacter aquaedulcis]MDN3549882.1 methyltransferase domain-containing protein [Mucilaginibacter aquaedulcis]